MTYRYFMCYIICTIFGIYTVFRVVDLLYKIYIYCVTVQTYCYFGSLDTPCKHFFGGGVYKNHYVHLYFLLGQLLLNS